MGPQKDIGDLYRAREHTEWHWRALGTAAAGLMLLGFLVFPASFPASADAQPNQSTLSIVSVVLLALGYSLSVALWFICRSWLFQLDVLFIPCLFSCVLGGVNVGISMGVHPAAPSQWSPASLSALALAVASSIIYAGLCAFTGLRIRRARARGGSVAGPFARSPSTWSDAEALVDSPDDPQRKAWARLLSPRPSDAHAAAPAPRDTYRLDIPDHVRLGARAPSTGSSPEPAASTASTLLASPARGDHSPQPPSPAPEPLARLTPTAAALQQARERTLHNERSAARLNNAATAATAAAAASSGSKGEMEARRGAVYRPDGGSDGPPGAGYGPGADYAVPEARDEVEPRYEVVNLPDFRVPLAQLRRRPEDGGARELEARMADVDRRK